MHRPGATGAGEESQEELDSKKLTLLVDIAQLLLDVIGIFEPTPFADGTNTLISLGRGIGLTQDDFGRSLFVR